MVTATMDKTVEPWMRRLYLPAYQVSEAARYVGVHPSTVSSWHYRDKPILPGRTRRRSLSYLELIEIAFVGYFRRLDIGIDHIREAREYMNSANGSDQHNIVSPPRPRDFLREYNSLQPRAASVEDQVINQVREYSLRNIEIEYPFASLRFKNERLHVLMEYRKYDSFGQRFSHLMGRETYGTSNRIYSNKNQFADFDYDHQIVVRWHPAGRDSQVMIDPRIAFGDPMVSGLSTYVIRGRYNAGETISEIADDFEISESAIWDALRFEGIQVA